MSFKQFLKESEDNLIKIKAILSEMSADEIDEFGVYLYEEFFDMDESEDLDQFEISDVETMIKLLGETFYNQILDMLDEDDETYEMEEGASRVMKASNLNKKKRKFMGNSKADLRKTKAQRKKDARMNKSKTKRYYKANKTKIAAYQKSRSDAIKKGKHNVKLRKTT